MVEELWKVILPYITNPFVALLLGFLATTIILKLLSYLYRIYVKKRSVK